MEPISSITYTVSGGRPQTFMWKGYGVRVMIPKGAVPPDLPPTVLQITASLTGHYEFPEDCELVSGIYCIAFPLEFVQPVTLTIQHCLDVLRTSQCSSLSFVVAKSTQKDLPYRFEQVEGGIFTPHCPCGSIKTTHFSFWGIVRSLRGSRQKDGNEGTHGQKSATAPANPARKSYSAQLFYRRNLGVYNWTLHFVIISNLAISRTVSYIIPLLWYTSDIYHVLLQALQQMYKDAQTGGEDIPITFEDDKIVLDISMEGVTEGNWSLVPISYPMVSHSN